MNAMNLKAIFPRLYAILPPVGNADITLSDDDSPVESSFVGDLVILYGHDLGNRYELVSQKQLLELGIAREELHRIAVDNLTATDKEIRLHNGDGYSFIICDGILKHHYCFTRGFGSILAGS